MHARRFSIHEKDQPFVPILNLTSFVEKEKAMKATTPREAYRNISNKEFQMLHWLKLLSLENGRLRF